MLLQTLFPFPLLLGSAHAAETVLGLYVFHRHGDRTPKSFPPVSLTPLGYAQVFQSGAWYRENYIAANAPSRINNISPNDVKLSQIAASAPQDNVLMSAAVGFLQGLYPAVEESSRQKLRNGSTVEAPLGGYQIIPVETVASGADSENTAWLQGASNCANAVISSNEYFDTEDYKSRLHSTQAFYDSLAPVISSTIERVNNSYKNAYTSEFNRLCPARNRLSFPPKQRY